MLVTPLLRLGGKSTIAKKIVNIIPAHSTYVEPFCGGAAVFFLKRRSEVEVLNDLDPSVYQFLSWLRDDPDALRAEILRLGPGFDSYALAHDVCVGKASAEPITQGAMAYVLGRLAFGGGGRRTRSGYVGHLRDKSRTFFSALDAFPRFSARLRGVHLSCADGVDIIRQFSSPDTVVLVDPPYRDTALRYVHDVHDERLYHACLESSAQVIMCGYGYLQRFAAQNGWHLMRLARRDANKGVVEESIITNFDVEVKNANKINEL